MRIDTIIEMYPLLIMQSRTMFTLGTFKMMNIFFLALIFVQVDVVKGQCEMISGRSGVITSPNHPGFYFNYLDVCWTIDLGGPVTVHFTALQTESCCDYITLYNAATQTAQILQLRGSTIPNDITSTADAMTIAFHSDYSITYAGFRLEYSVDGPTTAEQTTIITTELTTEQTTMITTPEVTEEVLVVTEEPLPVCGRQHLINEAPRMESLIIDDQGDMYLMTSSIMTQNGHQYAINHLFDKLDPEQDFPLTVHQTTVIYQHVFKQISGQLRRTSGVLLAESGTLATDGTPITGPVYPIFGHHLDIDNYNMTYVIVSDTFASYHGDLTQFAWYMPPDCYPEVTTPTLVVEEGLPWILIYFGIALGLAVLLCICGWGFFCFKKKSPAVSDSEGGRSSTTRQQPGRVQRITITSNN